MNSRPCNPRCTRAVLLLSVVALLVSGATGCRAGREELAEVEIQRLIASLEDPDANVRARAGDALKRARDARSVGPLIEALMDPRDDVRDMAAAALGPIQDPRAVEPLIATLRDDPQTDRGLPGWPTTGEAGHVRTSAARSLVIIGWPAVRPLAAALTGTADDSDFRANAARVLGQIGTPAVGPLVAALGDPRSEVRKLAARALRDVNDVQEWTLRSRREPDPRSIEPLIVATRDPDKDVRLEAVRALIVIGNSGGSRVVGPLAQAVADPDADVRRYAAAALGSVDDPNAVDFLVAALEHADIEVRRVAGEMLGKSPAPLAHQALLASLEANNLPAIAGAYQFFILRGWPETEAGLIRALHAQGTSYMAEAFANSGNTALEAAARTWAGRHGYRFEERTVTSPSHPRWGGSGN